MSIRYHNTPSQFESGGAGSLPDPVTESHGGTNQTTYAKGDIIHATAANTLGKLGISANQGDVLGVQSTGILGYQATNEISKEVSIKDDFLFDWGSVVGDNNWSKFVSGGTGAADITFTSANPGVYTLKTGVGTTGYAAILSTGGASNLLIVGSGTVYYEAIVKLSAVSDGTDTFAAIVGFIQNVFTITPAEGIYFNLSSGNITLNSAHSSTTTTQSTGVAASANWVRLGFIVNAAGTSIQAYVNGAAAGSPITTNIATGAMQLCFYIQKSAGTTSRFLSVDAMRLSILPTTPR